MKPLNDVLLAQFAGNPDAYAKSIARYESLESWALLCVLCFLGVIFLLVAPVIRADLERRARLERELDELRMKFRHSRLENRKQAGHEAQEREDNGEDTDGSGF